jgi:hypothetical protein
MLTPETYTNIGSLIHYLNENQVQLHDFLRPKINSKVHLDLLQLFGVEKLTKVQLSTAQDWALQTNNVLAKAPIILMPQEMQKLYRHSVDTFRYVLKVWKFTTRCECNDFCHCADVIWEDLRYYIDDFVDLMVERGFDKVGMKGYNMGWRSLTGTAECDLTTEAILHKLRLNTDYTLDIEWDITTNTLHVSRYHHDAPTGEFIEVMAGYQCERWQQFIPPEEDAVGLLEAFEEGAGGSCGYLHLCRDAVNEVIDDLYGEVGDLAKLLTTTSEFSELGKIYETIYELQSEVASLEELVKEHEWNAKRACNLIVDNIGEPINYDLLQEIRGQLE